MHTSDNNFLIITKFKLGYYNKYRGFDIKNKKRAEISALLSNRARDRTRLKLTDNIV